MSPRRTAAVAGVLLMAMLPQVTSTPSASASAEEPPTCRGREATHVGTPGEPLVTTTGPDVVVTNGAGLVRTRGGDDIVCVTLRRGVHLYPGRGDDLVDAHQYQGFYLRTFLGAADEVGSSGDDVYLGGERSDRVYVFSGDADDTKVIRTEGDEDMLKVGREYAGELTADLGGDSDDYVVNVPRPGLTVDGGQGHDFLETKCHDCEVAEFDMTAGTIRTDGADAGTALGFGVLDVENRRLQEISVIGTDGANFIVTYACRAEIRGLGRNDALVVHSAAADVCAEATATIWGGGGDDDLIGTSGDDLLIGGTGNDKAYGNDGTDECRTERREDCES